MRNHFHASLDALQADLAGLGERTSLIATQVADLRKGSSGDLMSAIESDVRSARAEHADIEGRCIALFATQAPVASDLRRLSAIIKVAADFETIAESLLHAARVVASKGATLRALNPLPDFGSRVREILSETVRFCETNDVRHAVRVRELAPGSGGAESLEAALVASISTVEEASERLPLLRLGPELERVMDLCRRIVDRMEAALPSASETTAAAPAGDAVPHA